MLTLLSWVACLLMVSMLVCGYLCLIVKETTRDDEQGSIFTSLYSSTDSIKLLYKLRYYSIYLVWTRHPPVHLLVLLHTYSECILSAIFEESLFCHIFCKFGLRIFQIRLTCTALIRITYLVGRWYRNNKQLCPVLKIQTRSKTWTDLSIFGDAKSTPCLSSRLLFSDFQDKSKRGVLICFKICSKSSKNKKKVDKGIFPIKKGWQRYSPDKTKIVILRPTITF